MNSKHAKSPCCGVRVRRFGPRRRQCVGCKRTWTIRPKKRGRPVHRTPASRLQKVFLRGFTLNQLLSKGRSVGLPAFRYRFRQALKRFVDRPSPQKIPRGPLVLLADGLWFQFQGVPWVLYLTALKPCRGNYAVFLDPMLSPGKEGASRWQKAFAAIPQQAQQRIQAMAVDNLPGMRKLAHQHGWVLQLCHFHLLLKLQVHRRGVRYTLRGGPVREQIYQLIRETLELPEGEHLRRSLERLRRLSVSDCGTVRIQTTVREFLQGFSFYRSYLKHPELGLPRTTNAIESMGRLLREMLRSSRPGSNPQSLLLWATAFIRMRSKITCNGHAFNRKT
jgi:hypothetical protein